jgi:spermidine synthase
MVHSRFSVLGLLERLPPPYRVEYMQWDPIARIELSRTPPVEPETTLYPSLTGDHRPFLARFRRMLTQNNNAFTYVVDFDGRRESLEGIEQTLYASAYQATSVAKPRVAIVGVGGGFDVLNALFFDASRVTGVEVNAATVDILTRVKPEYFRAWVQDPRVRLVEGEGRDFLSTTRESFDILQLSGVDSYSGTPAAAHVFSENYLYTREAFDTYLARLTPQGILNLMRLEYPQPREMLRALTTVVDALRRGGSGRPAEHIVMLTQTPHAIFTAMLVKKTPFAPAELQRLGEWAGRSRFFAISAAPGGLAGAADNNYRRFLSLNDSRREAAFIASAPFDIAPVDDDRPFFFRYSFWRHLVPGDPRIEGFTPVMEYSVLLLLIVIGLVAHACVTRPLRQLLRREAAPPQAWRYSVAFGGAGLGYLALEIGLLQKFGLLLGHPNYAVSVVLAALLLASGLGSLFSRAILDAVGGFRFVSYLLALVILVEYEWALPRLAGFVGLDWWTRVGIAFVLILPIGVCLGVFLPSAIEQLKRVAPAHVPWAWGVNGIFSVLAPVVSVAFSMTWGINALILSAIPIYLAVGLALPNAAGAR